MKILRSKFFMVVLLIVSLYLLFYAVSSWILSGKVEKEIDLIKQKGGFYSLSQFVPPPVADEENAARFYMAAIELVDFKWHGILPGEKDFYKLFKEKREEFQKELAKNNVVVELLIEAYNKPKCRFNLDYEEGYEMRVPNFIHIRNIAQMMAVKAYEELENNEIQKAIDDCVYEVHFLRNFGDANFLIQLMVNIACQRIISDPIKIMIERSVKADYSKLIEELQLLEEQMNGSFYRTMQGERVKGIDFFKKVIISEVDVLKNFAYDDSRDISTTDKIMVTVEYGLFKRPFTLYDELFFLKFYRRALEAIREGKVEEFCKNIHISKNLYISNMLIPNFGRAYEQYNKAMQNLKDLQARLKELNVPSAKKKIPAGK